MVRGENVVLLGEMDDEKEEVADSRITKVGLEEILEAH